MGAVRKTAIVVPCYNEEKRLKTGELLSFLAAEPGVFFVFVNDGSRDATGRLLKGLVGKSGGRAALVDLDRNCGKAEAVRRGFLKAFELGYEYIGYWDADLAAPLSLLPEFVSAMDAGKTVVLGSRVKLLGRNIRRRAARHYLGRLFATAVSVILKLPVYDTQCGAKLFRRTPGLVAAMSAPFRVKWTFDVELLGRLAFLEGAENAHDSWVELPLASWEEVGGSKVRAADFLRSGFELVKLMTFFRSGRRGYLEGLAGAGGKRASAKASGR